MIALILQEKKLLLKKDNTPNLLRWMHDQHKSWTCFWNSKNFNAGLSDLESQLDLTTFKPQTEKAAEDS